ncbi:MAG: hypothetical protein K6L81_09055 [Agarilytica sp.]
MDLNFQYAHHLHEESVTKSNVNVSDAIAAFDQFEWESEVNKANELQKCSPTLSVIIDGRDEMVWVSGYGEGSDLQFVSESHFPGEVSKWFGLSKSLGTVNLHTQTFDKAQARKAIELMIAKNYEGLRALYA